MNNLDRAINSDLLIVTKSLLPYLNVDRQKPIAIFIKVMELIYTVNLFSDENSVRSMSRTQESGWEREFLNDVKSNLNTDKAYFIDAILKLTEAKNLLTHPTLNTQQNTPSATYHLHPSDSGIPEDQPFSDANIPSQTKGPSSPNTASADQLLHSLSSMLDPNQAQLLKMLTSLLIPQSSKS